jgi:hypothetical protein
MSLEELLSYDHYDYDISIINKDILVIKFVSLYISLFTIVKYTACEKNTNAIAINSLIEKL